MSPAIGGWESLTRSATQQLRAGDVAGPSLVFLGRPAAFAGQQLPQVRMIQRPEDVGATIHGQPGPECLLLRQAGYDHALVRVVLALDPAPQRLDVIVDRSGAPDDLEHRCEPDLADA